MNTVNIQIDIAEQKIIHNCNIINLCSSVLSHYSINNSQLNIIVTNDEFLRQLKKEFFDVDVYTDVISFNLENKGEPIDGEIYISLERVKENAIEFGISSNSELKRIIIHGVLHLIGYDDKTKEEKMIMTDLENKFLETNSEIRLI